MLKLLLKKQLTELFRNYFLDTKKGTMRPKWQVALFFVFYIAIVFGVLGGMFFILATNLCGPMISLEVGWMYFLLMSLIALILGIFGSVFNTYAGLYLAKDNDLLLSLPIPVNVIITSRLLNVYIMGSMYSLIAMIPTLAVYWITAGFTPLRFILGILLTFTITLIVMLLSCILGWAVAKISQRFHNKSYAGVLSALAFFIAYYYFYYRASSMLDDLLLNAAVYGKEIKGSAYILYLFGSIGEGNLLAAFIFLAVSLVLCALVWNVISRTFFAIAADTGAVEKKTYKERSVKRKSVFSALLAKEFRRFTSDANYMLNCGLGVLLIPAAGILILIKGGEFMGALDTVFVHAPYTSAVMISVMLCMMTSMCNMAVPSVSLEGKNIWIPRSLPVTAKTVLRAKASMQLILTGIPVAIAAILCMFAVNAPVYIKALSILTVLAFTFFATMFGMFLGVRMANLSWVSELSVIKQSASIMVILFGTWIAAAAMGAAWLLLTYQIGAAAWLSILTLLLGAGGLYFLHWLDTKGAKHFAEL